MASLTGGSLNQPVQGVSMPLKYWILEVFYIADKSIAAVERAVIH
jgi:hypothetical protein